MTTKYRSKSSKSSKPSKKEHSNDKIESKKKNKSSSLKSPGSAGKKQNNKNTKKNKSKSPESPRFSKKKRSNDNKSNKKDKSESSESSKSSKKKQSNNKKSKKKDKSGSSESPKSSGKKRSNDNKSKKTGKSKSSELSKSSEKKRGNNNKSKSEKNKSKSSEASKLISSKKSKTTSSKKSKTTSSKKSKTTSSKKSKSTSLKKSKSYESSDFSDKGRNNNKNKSEKKKSDSDDEAEPIKSSKKEKSDKNKKKKEKLESDDSDADDEGKLDDDEGKLDDDEKLELNDRKKPNTTKSSSSKSKLSKSKPSKSKTSKSKTSKSKSSKSELSESKSSGSESSDSESSDSGSSDSDDENKYDLENYYKKGTYVPFYNGTMKKVEEIKIGDKLIGDDGEERIVEETVTGKGRLYGIYQQNYGAYVVNKYHVLCVRMPDHKVIFWSNTQSSWNMVWLDKKSGTIKREMVRVCQQEKYECGECGEELSSSITRHYKRKHPRTRVPVRPRKPPTTTAPDTQEVRDARKKMEAIARKISDDNVLEISVKDYIKLGKTTRSRLSGYVGECVKWNGEEIELDSYVLGLWLGDGYQTGYGFAINEDKDPEILSYLRNWGKENDAEFNRYDRITFGARSATASGVAPLKKQLTIYDLVNNKHMPKEYLVNSRSVRLKMLAGLIDTDGSVSRNGTRINISQGMNHEKLANGIIFLVRSLGFKCCAHVKNTQWTYEGELRRGEAVNMNISGEGVEDIPTRVDRKKCKPPVKRETTGNGRLTIAREEIGDFVGIKTDGNGRFVIDDFTVT